MYQKVTLAVVVAFFMSSCGQNSSRSSGEALVDQEEISASKEDLTKTTRSIFYNMFLPCEMVYIFEESKAPFNSQLLNDIDNVSAYTTVSKKALNLGVYGVDLGYIKIHDQLTDMKKYAHVINRMSNELGIPSEHVVYALDYFDRGVSDLDTLFRVTCELFEVTDSYLNMNQRQGTAALIILGGWVEALYITAHMMGEKASPEVMERVGRQKYSLNSIISLLTMYEDDLSVTNYLVLLNQLKREFDQLEIYYQDEEAIQIDTVRRQIVTDHAQTTITKESFERIRVELDKIRGHIVN